MESTDSSSGSQQQPQLPPGFRFHPTDEELVVHYLKKKATSAPLPVTIIAEVDLYKFDPWELPGKANFGEHEWYFFSPRDRKYPNGARPNRAATSGYWKATGTDKPILTSGGTQKVGVKKALVFYGGKPPKGIKTNWIMHEYRLTDTTTATRPPNIDLIGKKASLRLDDWVLCRIYKKNNTTSNSQRSMERDREDSMDDMLAPPLPIKPSANGEPPNPSPQLQRAANNYTALLDNDDTFFEGLLTEDGIPTNQLIQQLSASPGTRPNGLLMVPATPKRTMASTYWSDAGTIIPQHPAKRFHPFNSGGSISSSNRTSVNNSSSNSSTNNEDPSHHRIAMLLNQIPQTQGTSYNQPMILGGGALGDGSGTIFRHPYHLSGLNWGS